MQPPPARCVQPHDSLARSIGSTNDGRLEDGCRIAPQGPGYVAVGDRGWATDETVAWLRSRIIREAGEWESHSARFSASGAALELPRKYIPEAYVEWERTLHEWPGRVVSQCKKRGAPRTPPRQKRAKSVTRRCARSSGHARKPSAAPARKKRCRKHGLRKRQRWSR